MPEHYDNDQREFAGVDEPVVGLPWWTFCACGLAFGGATSQEAYARWEQHEADES